MRHLLPLALVVLLPAAAAAQQPSARAESVVITAGEGVVNAVPDRAWISITAESRAGNPRDAQRRNAEVMRPVTDNLRGAGLPADAIRTGGYDLQQEFDFVDGRRVSRGFVARNTIEVRVDDIDRVGEFLGIAVGSGATSVGGLRFDLKDRARVEREALRLAVADARGRADALAAAAGQAIDRVLEIREQGVSAPPMPDRAFAMRAEAAQAAPVISAGEMEIRAQVTLTASLK
ncbi:MAG: SIMPL domain-containing protein [Vicinamibacterales bacterium]